MVSIYVYPSDYYGVHKLMMLLPSAMTTNSSGKPSIASHMVEDSTVPPSHLGIIAGSPSLPPYELRSNDRCNTSRPHTARRQWRHHKHTRQTGALKMS